MARHLRVFKFGTDGRIGVKLYDTTSIPGEVYWSPRKNSYVLAEGQPPLSDEEEGYSVWKIDGRWVRLFSVNGYGEVRWQVLALYILAAERYEEQGIDLDPDWDCTEMIGAARFFRLVP